MGRALGPPGGGPGGVGVTDRVPAALMSSMSTYFHFRAVPSPALRNSPAWLLRLFEDDWDTVRARIGRHREEVLDKGYLDHEFLYAGALPRHTPDGPPAHVVLGGGRSPRPVPTGRRSCCSPRRRPPGRRLPEDRRLRRAVAAGP